MDEKIVLMFVTMFLMGIGVVAIIGFSLEVLSHLEFHEEAFYTLMICVCCLFGEILWFMFLGGWLG